jgi:beta-xylosidase
MKKKISFLFASLIIISNLCNGQNPIIKDLYTADPSAHVFKGRIYVYTSHDQDTATTFNMKDWRVFSTKNMKKWKDHGSPLSLDKIKWASSFAWAPDCAYYNGKYYFYYPVDKNAIGVAVNDKPFGNFKDALGKPLVSTKTTGVVSKKWLIDPAIFIDDDKTPYLLFGMDDLNIIKLNKDMVSFDGQVRQTEGLKDFYEAVWMHKYKGKYYLSYSTSRASAAGKAQIVYATSDSPYGPFEYKGIILDAVNSGTNHHSIVEYKGNWYLFYHNSDLYFSKNPDVKPIVNWKTPNPFRRSVCVDLLKYNEDGTIQRVIPTKEGIDKIK